MVEKEESKKPTEENSKKLDEALKSTSVEESKRSFDKATPIEETKESVPQKVNQGPRPTFDMLIQH